MASSRGIYWLKPSLMLAWLVLGIAVALGHHFFYSWLDGRVIESKTQQEWYGRVGTGLAFLEKSLLAAAATIGYTQLLWRTMRSKPIPVDGVDKLFSLTTNVWNLASLKVWQSGPLAAVVGVFIWLLPLSVVVTPSTLLIVPSPVQNSTVIQRPLPIIAYPPERYAQWDFKAKSRGGTTHKLSNYIKPSTSVSRLVTNVASSGNILPIQAPFPNSSYSLSFHGPSIVCGPADPDVESRVNETIENGDYILPYVAFVPSPPDAPHGADDAKGTRDILNGLNLTLQGTSPDTAVKKISYDVVPPAGSARLFLATYAPGKDGKGRVPRTVTECSLYNSSYDVDFNFINNRQSVNVTKISHLNGIDFATYHDFNLPEHNPPDFFTGVVGCALMDALSKMLVGFLRTASSTDGWVADGEVGIINTVLMETQELRRLYQPVAQDDLPSGLEPLSIRNMTIVEAIEEISRNMTLSLFSNSHFLQDESVAAIGNITVRSPQNIYSYRPRNLAIAYGLGVTVTIFIVIVGGACIHSAEGSFSTSFSTILRTTRARQLDSLVQAQETHGKEPLPDHLADATISLRNWSTVEGNNAVSFVLDRPASISDSEKRRAGPYRQVQAEEQMS